MPLTARQVHYWLTNFHAPDRLDSPEMRALLRAHGRPHRGSTAETALAARALLRGKIEVLKPPPEAAATVHAWQTYSVVMVSFLGNNTIAQTARKLAMSERQVSRERSRAVALILAELEAPKKQEGSPAEGDPSRQADPG